MDEGLTCNPALIRLSVTVGLVSENRLLLPNINRLPTFFVYSGQRSS